MEKIPTRLESNEDDEVDEADLFSHKRKVGVWGLALLTFFNVSGGPWGSEPIVSSAGPLPGFICLIAMSLCWGLPICLVTAEMSSALPNNGGYVLWVDTAFGGFWGFQESFWSWGSCVVDNALYPVLAYETFIAMYQGDVTDPLDSDALEAVNSFWIAYISKLVLTLLFSMPVLLGRTEWVTKGMGVMIVLLTIPFAIMLPYMMWRNEMHWGMLGVSRKDLFAENSTVDWVGLIHVTFWNFNGFDCASTCAGEVRDPGKSYPRGLLSALVVVTLMTGVPLAIAVACDTPPWENWNVGWWSAIANQSAGLTFAWSVVFSSLIGTFGMHAAVMWEDAWQLCGMAEQGLAPRWLAGRNEKLGTPQNATIMSMCVVMALIIFDFRSMVIVDNFFSVASGLLEVAAFAHLKRKRPDIPRPYKIPGVNSDFTLFLFLLTPVTVGGFVLLSSLTDGWISFVTLIPFLCVGLVLPSVFHHVQIDRHTRKSVRGISISKSDEPLQTLPTIGGIYGALKIQSFQSPSGRQSINPSASHDSIFSSRKSRAEESNITDFFVDPEVDHIFDSSVQFGSIFTDATKLYKYEDDEYLSAVGKDDVENGFFLGEEDDEDRSSRHQHLLYNNTDEEEEAEDDDRKYRHHRLQKLPDSIEEEEYGGTDEERSYDGGSLD